MIRRVLIGLAASIMTLTAVGGTITSGVLYLSMDPEERLAR